jgi:hypothetical protein
MAKPRSRSFTRRRASLSLLLACRLSRLFLREVGAFEAKNKFGHLLDRAVEAAGVEFIDENGGGPGVRLRQPKNPGS